MGFSEAKEQFGTMLRWTAQPKDQDQADKTEFMGEVIQGFYLRKKTGVGQNSSNVYEIQLADGRLVSIWGSGVLDGKFDSGYKNGPIPTGCEVRISYLGIAQPKSTGGRAYQNFKVECDVESRRPMTEAGAPVAPAQPQYVAPTAQPAAPQYTQTAAPVAPQQQQTPGQVLGF